MRRYKIDHMLVFDYGYGVFDITAFVRIINGIHEWFL